MVVIILITTFKALICLGKTYEWQLWWIIIVSVSVMLNSVVNVINHGPVLEYVLFINAYENFLVFIVAKAYI